MGATTKDGIYNLLEWLGFLHYQYREWGGHMIVISVLDNLIVHCFQNKKIMFQSCYTLRTTK